MFTLKSNKLINRLTALSAALSGRRPAARIVVPEELAWWYYQEFGTVGGYTIAAEDGKFLRLPAAGIHPNPTFRDSVIHPGVSPKSYIRDILPEVYVVAARAATQALMESGYSADAVQSVLMGTVLPEIKERIADSMSRALHQHRTADDPGKLGVEEPAEVFRNSAEIVDTGI